MTSQKKRRQVWSEFWATGSHNSCMRDSRNSSFSDETDKLWQSLALQLTASSKVLDLCTGNGAVIEQFVQTQSQNDGNELSEFIGIDLAKINPSWFISSKTDFGGRVRFQSGVALDSIPAELNNFDLVTSQFGFEYAINELLLNRLNTLIAKKGRFVAIIHHKDSLFIKNGREELNHLRYLLSSDYFEFLSRMLKIMARLRNPKNLVKVQNDKNAIQARNAYNQIVAEIDSKVNTSYCPDLLIDTLTAGNNALNLARQSGLSKAKVFFANYYQNLPGLETRLQELLDVAMTETDIEQLTQKIKNHIERSEVSYRCIKQANEVIAWHFELTRL